MKIQYLAVIFIIIIMPITIVFSEYINNQIKTIEIENTYNARLLDSTQDAIKAYQLNTVNNSLSDLTPSKVEELEAAVNTLFNSLLTNFKYDGYKSSVLKEYVPAVVFAMYDGYYIYSPFINTLTAVNHDDVDEEYKDNDVLNGLKPYVYYNCRYQGKNLDGENYDIVITYTLDNFITIEGTIGDNYVYDYGYLIDGITTNPSGTDYIYDGVTFKETDTETMQEYIGGTQYKYVKIDGVKYYLERKEGDDERDTVFYINALGQRMTQVEEQPEDGTGDEDKQKRFELYEKAIENNKSGYVYYKNAYKFTKRVREKYGLDNLSSGNAIDFASKDFTEYENIFALGNAEEHIEYSNSKFNQHRMEVIKNVIQTNLQAAITGFSRYSSANIEYIMPKISDTDWELLANNVCIATFMQGMSIGGKVYNSYSVVPNNLNKEYVDENDIYILTNSKTYVKANDSTIASQMASKDVLGYYPGVLKTNFERRTLMTTQDDKEIKSFYYPISYGVVGTDKKLPYLGSYTSIIGSASLNSIIYKDMYRYMNGNDDNVKEVYYRALGRERMGAFNVNNGYDRVFCYTGADEKEYTEYKPSIENWYFLKEYE